LRKRRLLVLAPLLAAGVVWLFGRAPSRHALEQECRRFHAERVAEEQRFQRDTGRLLQDGKPLRARREAHARYLLEHRRMEMGGWTVVFVPPGAAPPAPSGFQRAASFDPSVPADASHLQGEMEIWLAPRGALARLLHGLGLSP
jgi:hypothetical protein